MSRSVEYANLPSTARLETFSDGVFAIAATLLVLELRAEPGLPTPLRTQLAHIWPSYLAFAVSFAVVGILWVNHHGLFHVVARVDRSLLFLNLLLLGVTCFLPFPTGVLGNALRVGGQDARTAAVLYSVTALCLSAAFFALWAYLRRHVDLLEHASDIERLRVAQRRGLVGPIAYGIALVVAFFAPVACLFLHGAVAVWFMVPPRTRRTLG